MQAIGTLVVLFAWALVVEGDDESLEGTAESWKSEKSEEHTANPLAKTIELMDSLKDKIEQDGEAEDKAYKEYTEWCDDTSKNERFSIETASKKKEDLDATISKANAEIEEATTKIEELAGSISEAEADLKDATAIREKEHANFVPAEMELSKAVDALSRAITIIERETAKNAALVQVDVSNFQGLISGLSSVIDAAGMSGSDKKQLIALVQANANSNAQDKEEAAADAQEEVMEGGKTVAASKSSGGIMDVLEDLKDKAEEKLSELRKDEANAAHNYEMLKTSLESEISADKKDLEEEKENKSAAEEALAIAQGELSPLVKDLAESTEALEALRSTCMAVAADHEKTVADRAAELAVLAKAKSILAETTAGAASFLQLRSGTKEQTQADLKKGEVISLLKRLAKRHHSRSLHKLVSQIAVLMQYGAKFGDDPFAKVKGLITSLIERLQKEAAEEASEKAYCDEELAKTEAKQSELEDDLAKLGAKLDKAVASSAKLKEDVKELEGELALLAKEQMESDKIRTDEHDAYVAARKDLELGLLGIGKALDVLRDYYGGAAALVQQPPVPEKHEKSSGAGGGIIGMLEVVESDMSKNLADVEEEEADAVTQYEATNQENKLAKSLKEQDIKYKTQEFKGLDKMVVDLGSDKDGLSTELAAVNEYDDKIKGRCIAKPESYEERKKRREEEIKGLKEAMSILSGDTFIQQGALRR